MKNATLPLAAVLALAASVHASEWSGGNASWSSDTTPGWSGTGVPNAQGAVAAFNNVANATITQDVTGGVTLGRFLRTGTASADLTLRAGTGVSPIFIFDQDGSGPECAVISNATPHRISFGSANYTLQDDLVIAYTGGTQYNNSYCISISGIIGGSGNLVLDSNVVNPDYNNIALTGNNTFTGSALVRRGSVYGSGTMFGNKNNPVTLGEAACGAVIVSLNGSSVTLANPVTVAGNTGGETTIASKIVTNKDWTHTVSGTVLLNGDLSLSIPSGSSYKGTFRFTGVISGDGAIHKKGALGTLLSAANTYAGGTFVDEGALYVTSAGRLGTGDVAIAAGATLSISNALAVASTASVTLDGTLDLPAGVNPTANALFIDGHQQFKGTYGAVGSGAANERAAGFTGLGVLTVLTGPDRGTIIVIQ